MAKLLIEGVNGSVVTFPLIGGEILIGRMDSADLVLDSPAVSRIHAKIVKEGREHVIVDLESSTGTRVNEDAITRRHLRDGDVIQIAANRLEYRA